MVGKNLSLSYGKTRLPGVRACLPAFPPRPCFNVSSCTIIHLACQATAHTHDGFNAPLPDPPLAPPEHPSRPANLTANLPRTPALAST